MLFWGAGWVSGREARRPGARGEGWLGSTYIDAPEFFHGVEGDDFFEEVIPVVALGNVLAGVWR